MHHGMKQCSAVLVAERRASTVAELSHAREFQVDPLACMQSPAENGQA